MMELGQTDRAHAARAIAELRSERAFARELEILPSALAKSLELMRKAGLADAATLAAGPSTHDDSYRLEALKALDAPLAR